MEILSQRTLPTGSPIVQLLRLDRASFLELIPTALRTNGLTQG